MTANLAHLLEGTPAITLRELAPQDLPQLNQWRNDPDLLDRLGNNFLYISSAVDEQWYQSYLSNRHQNVRLSLCVGPSETYIGNVNLTNLHPINRTAEFSMMIGDRDYWSQGIGTRVTRAMIFHGFENLNLNRIYLTVLTRNLPAIRVYEKCGFVQEGQLRQALYKNGTYEDLLLMAILRDSVQGMGPAQPD